MIGSKHFWIEEADAPLLNRNFGFARPENAEELVSRAKKLVDLVADRAGHENNFQLVPDCEDEGSRRIFELDAERTFNKEHHRSQMVAVLQSLWPELKDYHQGLGFLVAYLLLFLKPEDVGRIVLGLHRNFVPGYFKSAPAAYVRDAKVYQKLLEKRFPAIGEHVASMSCPEAYVSKWFIGMNVHVLTFEALFMFFEAFLQKGDIFLFQYALALIDNVKSELLRTKDVSNVLAILRLDKKLYPNSSKAEDSAEAGSFFTKIVEDAINFDLSDYDIEKLRAEAMDEMRIEEEKRKEREKNLNLSDDEIVFSDEEEF